MEPETALPQYSHLGWKTFLIFVSDRSHMAAAIGVLAVISTFFHGQGPALLTAFLTTLFVAAIVITIVYSLLHYQLWRYHLEADSLRIRRGVFHRQDIAIPYRQIQNVSIERNILNQLTRTAKIVVLTSAEDEDEEINTAGIIPVIDFKLALMLQEELMSRANIQKVTSV